MNNLFDSLKDTPELWDIFTGKERASESGNEGLKHPAVSEYLVQNGFDISYPDNKKFAICLTHDVDDIYPPLSHHVISGLWSLKNRDLGGLKKYAISNGLKSAAYLNFRQIMELESRYGAKSTFFFITASRDPVRFRYNIEDIADEIKLITERGWEVGLHGGYYSFCDINAVKNEKSRLEKALGREVIGYRNHYLRFEAPDTWAILEKCRFKYDTTCGYTNTVGFRNGMCHPFRPYDLNRRQWLGIYEFPLHVMESAMYDFTKPNEAWEPIRLLLEKAESVKGVITVLWHSETFSCPFRAKWAELYEKILEYGKDHNAFMTSAEELYQWWEENGY